MLYILSTTEKKMTKKKELLIIPKEICIIISEYSACKCGDCNRNNNRKYFSYLEFDINIY